MGTIKTTIQTNLETRFTSNITELLKQVKDFQNQLNKIGMPTELSNSFKNTEESLRNLLKSLSKDPTNKVEFKGLKNQVDSTKTAFADLNTLFNSLVSKGGFDNFFKGVSKLKEELKQLEDAFKNGSDLVDLNKIQALSNVLDTLQKDMGSKFPKTLVNLKTALDTKDINQITEAFENLGKQIDKNKLVNGYEELQNAVKELIGGDYNSSSINKWLDSIFSSISDKKKEITEAIEQGQKELNNFINTTGNIEPAKKNMDALASSVTNVGDSMIRSAQEAERFTERLKQFFSLTNGFLLLRKAIQQAKAAVAELDQSITAIAVVSDFSVGELWDTLPQFTKKAAELGGTISDLYKGTQLWVEQGLDMDVSLRMATEAMKMARVAGISAKEATDALTSALRGFNMEINEMSAQRISDVYSELAKITAADTDEISNAMTKVASLASSANMEFENTAAFLSQIIELLVTCNSNVA